jgi:Fibronectin type III domain
VHVEGNLLVVEWDAPPCNNSPIKGYNVYLSKKTIKIGEINPSQDHQEKEGHQLVKVATKDIADNVRYHEFRELELGTCYYVVVTAINELGEGYKAAPFMVRTLSQNLDTQAGSLYVWGSNTNSELGLSDDQVLKNISFY